MKILLFIILIPILLFSEEPWEAEDIIPIEKIVSSQQESYHKPSYVFIRKMISLYQHQSTENTISRCPFYISCSSFALKSVKEHGIFLGSLLFIDRFFYRENSSIYKHYNFKRRDNSVLKLNDRYFLYGDSFEN